MSLIQANNYLAVHLHRLLSQEKKNVFFSPFSVSVAMGMLLCSAEGETASELSAALGHEHAGVKKEDIAPNFEQMMSILLEQNDSYTLSSANSMLIQKGFKVKDEYKQVISNFFKSLIREVDFMKDTQNVIHQINQWVKEKTNNMIPKFVEILYPDTVLVLLNAVYFKGTWEKQFDKKETYSQQFYNNGDKNYVKKVDMMHLKESFPFYEDSTYQAVKLPYVGNEVAMVIVLPREKNGLASLEASLSPSFFQDLNKNIGKTKVKVTIPRFRLEYAKSLIPCFKELGVKRVFKGGAELTHLSDSTNLAVDEIFHKAVLDVNEEGSEAAAATMVVVGLRSAPRLVPEFVADHPFVFIIHSSKNDLILFMGRVNEL